MKPFLRFLVLATVLIADLSAHAFFNTATGRWLSRDPIAEVGGKNLYAFVANDGVRKFDKLGLKCCLITYKSPTYNHSALECDGIYISAFPEDDIKFGEDDFKWRDKEEDEESYTKKGTHPDQTETVCFECLDSQKVKEWFDDYKASDAKFCGAYNNCADVASQAIIAGLPDSKQVKPECPCASPPNIYVVEDLLDMDGLTPPGYLHKMVSQLASNGCNRYKCSLFIPPPPGN